MIKPYSFPFTRFCSLLMSSVGELVEQFSVSAPITAADKEVVDTLKQLADSDPVICREVAEAIKRKLYCSVETQQLRAADLLDKLVDNMDLTFQQVVNEKDFLAALEKLVSRDARSTLSGRVRSLFIKWVNKFSGEQDILPNYALYHSRLVEQGLLEPTKGEEAQVMDQFLINEAEGQDPEEFKKEVRETLKLFDEVYTTIKAGPKSSSDEISRSEALISLAANLDRYSEQFGLWIEQLEPGPYMEEAMGLNDRVTDALQRYKILRSSALREASSDDSSESSSSSDEE
jgi:hypothetical protein